MAYTHKYRTYTAHTCAWSILVRLLPIKPQYTQYICYKEINAKFY